MTKHPRAEARGCMMSPMRTLGALAVVLLLSGCGGGADEADDSEPEPLPTVSAVTTCGELLDGDDAPMTAVVDLMGKPSTSPADAGRARDYADELEGVGAQAGDELKPHVTVVVDELREFADAVDALESFDTGTMVTSLSELNNVCSSEPRP